MEVSELRIAEDLHADGEITDEQLRCWKLHKEGYSFFKLRTMLRRSARTLWKWYNKVQDKVEQVETHEKAQGEARCGVTIFRGGNGETETPVAVDQVLLAIGFTK